MEELLDYIHQWLKENLKSYVYTELYTNEPIIDIDKAMLGLRHDLKIVEPDTQGLDEAAKNIVNDTIDTNDTTIVKYQGLLEYLVKAGAKWMAEQGEMVEAEIEEPEPLYWRILLELPGTFMVDHNLKPGDKVIVQIRKKEE